jgi:phosphoadenosine phosphosulfate reductase
MLNPGLLKKIDQSIKILKQFENIALKFSNEGYYLAFSGGKDSQVIYKLCQLADVKFQSYMNITTLDPPEVIRFIKKYYSNVKFVKPEKSFFKLIETQSLPTRIKRWCCKKLKETSGNDRLVILGLRRSESLNRSKRKVFDDTNSCKLNKIILCPILEWNKNDVWNFIRSEIGYYCNLYDKGYSRIGCICCPMQNYNSKIYDLKLNPKFKYAFIKSIQISINNGHYKNFDSANDVFNWWLSGSSVKCFTEQKKQLSINFKYF